MPNTQLFTQTLTLQASSTMTQSNTSAALTIPLAQSYRWIVQCNTVTGTSPTLVMAVATSFDGGSTYNEIFSTTSITATGSYQSVVTRPYLGYGDAATEASSTLLGTTDIAAAILGAANGPINTQFVKLRFILTGTSPSFSNVTVGLITCPFGANE